MIDGFPRESQALARARANLNKMIKLTPLYNKGDHLHIRVRIQICQAKLVLPDITFQEQIKSMNCQIYPSSFSFVSHLKKYMQIF